MFHLFLKERAPLWVCYGFSAPKTVTALKSRQKSAGLTKEVQVPLSLSQVRKAQNCYQRSLWMLFEATANCEVI